MIKTSETDPIRVAFLPAGYVPLPGRLGMTFAPGKTGHFSGGEMHRDLETDLRRLRQSHHTDVLVLMVEDHELVQFNIEGLVSAAETAGLLVDRHPMPDAGTPPAMETYLALIGRILGHLAADRDVVVTCRGGLGRTGMVVASVLVAGGLDPKAAIALVRATRSPLAVETAAQEAYVAAFAEAWSGRPLPALATLEAGELVSRDRFRACLLGGAIGDALGNPIEFQTLAVIRSLYPEGYAQAMAAFSSRPMPFTDDTQMTLFTAEGLIRATHERRETGRHDLTTAMIGAYSRWYATQEGSALASWAHPAVQGWLLGQKGLHSRQAPGMTCLAALKHPVPVAANDSKGCGAVMRVAPIGLAATSREEAFVGGIVAGRISHGHPSGYLSAGYFASVIFDLVRGESLVGAMAAADGILAGKPDAGEMQRAMAQAQALAARGMPGPEDLESLGGGWVGEEALAIALACALTADLESPEGIAAALWRSVCHSGDSDSTGAICGNLFGAMVGVGRLPAKLLRAVSLMAIVDQVAVDLHAVAIRGQALDLRDYPAG